MLVYGSNIAAFTAALQAAKSNVPTVWVVNNEEIVPEFKGNFIKISSNEHLDGGIWMSILMQMAISKESNDSLASVVKKDFNTRLAINAIEKMITEQMNLTVIRNQTIKEYNKGKRDWTVYLSNNQKIEVVSIVDATENSQLYSKYATTPKDNTPNDLVNAQDLSLALSRTSLAAAESNNQVKVLLLRDVIAFEKDNLFDLGLLRKIGDGPESLAIKASFGQAIGATAAYTAFFKSNTSKIDIRKLQAELLTFKARIMPYQDITINDPHYSSIQKNYLTGFLLGKLEAGKYNFNKQELIKFDDIKPVFNDIYTRSQLWFLDNYRNDVMNWKELLGLIKFVSFKGEEVDKQVEKDWSTKRKFEGSFNPETKVNKTHFAVMADLYTESFAKSINIDGSFVK